MRLQLLLTALDAAYAVATHMRVDCTDPEQPRYSLDDTPGSREALQQLDKALCEVEDSRLQKERRG